MSRNNGHKQLVERAMGGDRVALGQLLSQYQQRLYNVVLRMVSNREDAAEITQDAMVKIIEHIDDYNGKCQITTWMIRIAMNLSISHLRKRRLRNHSSIDASANWQSSDDRPMNLRQTLEDGGNLPPEQRVEEREMMGHLLEALDRLDEDFRSVLVLRDINEMDYQQIADCLDVPIGTVKSRLFRARLALRQEVSKLYDDLPGHRPSSPASGSTRAEVSDG